MTAHTSGNWKVSKSVMKRNGFINPMIECTDQHEPFIAELCGQDRPYAEKEANALLVASAPDMLAMLKDVSILITARCDVVQGERAKWGHTLSEINDLIKKAEG